MRSLFRPARRSTRPLADLLRQSAAAAALLLAAGQAAWAADPPASQPPLDRAAVESIVREYLLANPEILLEAMHALENKEQAREMAATTEAIRTNRDALFAAKASPVSGNPKGDVALVEFFDYNCGYCKATQPQRNAAVAKDGKVKVIHKEFPILGATSVIAAKAALAADLQGKYPAMHEALMGHEGPLSEEDVFAAAGTVGLDVKRLETDMESAAVTGEIAANIELARSLGIRGTPAFVVGETLIPGAIDEADFASVLAAERDRRKQGKGGKGS